MNPLQVPPRYPPPTDEPSTTGYPPPPAAPNSYTEFPPSNDSQGSKETLPVNDISSNAENNVPQSLSLGAFPIQVKTTTEILYESSYNTNKQTAESLNEKHNIPNNNNPYGGFPYGSEKIPSNPPAPDYIDPLFGQGPGYPQDADNEEGVLEDPQVIECIESPLMHFRDVPTMTMSGSELVSCSPRNPICNNTNILCCSDPVLECLTELITTILTYDQPSLVPCQNDLCSVQPCTVKNFVKISKRRKTTFCAPPCVPCCPKTSHPCKTSCKQPCNPCKSHRNIPPAPCPQPCYPSAPPCNPCSQPCHPGPPPCNPCQQPCLAGPPPSNSCPSTSNHSQLPYSGFPIPSNQNYQKCPEPCNNSFPAPSHPYNPSIQDNLQNYPFSENSNNTNPPPSSCSCPRKPKRTVPCKPAWDTCPKPVDPSCDHCNPCPKKCCHPSRPCVPVGCKSRARSGRRNRRSIVYGMLSQKFYKNPSETSKTVDDEPNAQKYQASENKLDRKDAKDNGNDTQKANVGTNPSTENPEPNFEKSNIMPSTKTLGHHGQFSASKDSDYSNSNNTFKSSAHSLGKQSFHIPLHSATNSIWTKEEEKDKYDKPFPQLSKLTSFKPSDGQATRLKGKAGGANSNRLPATGNNPVIQGQNKDGKNQKKNSLRTI